MKKRVKYVLIGVIILASVVGGIYYMMLPLPVRMTEVRPQAAELSFTEQGVVSASRTMLVFPVAQGEISGLYVREGQSVQAGEPLVSVDDTVLRQRLEQVQNGIRGLEAQLANVEVEAELLRQNLRTTLSSLQGELRAINSQAALSGRVYASQADVQQILISHHEAELIRVRENLQNVETLFAIGAVPRVDLDAAISAVSAVEVQLETARGQMAVISAGAGIDDAQFFQGIRASLNAQIAGINQQLAQDTTAAVRENFKAMIAIEKLNIAQIEREIENAVITAPVSGTITYLHAMHTNFVSAASPVAEITIDDSLEINVYVSTQDVSSINEGDRVMLTFRQRTRDIEFYGIVSDVDSTAVVRFTALGVEERKVNVTIEPGIPDGVDLGIGFAVDATFFVFREENRLVVPRTAVFRADGADMVWVVIGRDGTGVVQSVPVVTGLELRTDIVIESGLSPGDFVINDANNQDLRNGARVVSER